MNVPLWPADADIRVLQAQFRLQSVRRMISLMNTVGLAMRDGLAHQTHFQE